MKARIICDGSYDNLLRVGVSAHSITVNGTQIEDFERASDINSSVECELFAIYTAMKALRKHLVNHKLDKVDFLSIYSDHKASVQRLNEKKRSTSDSYHYQEILNILPSIAKESQFHKVDAHVKSISANKLERRHNVIDKIARNELQAFRKDVINVNNRRSKVYSAILGPEYKLAHKDALYAIGYKYAQEGFVARVFKGHTIEHPLLDGIQAFCQDNSIELSSRLLLLPSPPESGGECNEHLFGCVGLDAILLNTATRNNKFSKLDPTSKLSARIGTLSRLIFGIQKPPKKGKSVICRQNKGAKFMLDLSYSPSTRKIINRVRTLIDIDVYRPSHLLVDGQLK